MRENEPGPIAVTVVTGFLGAGKTTLLNRWLGEYPRGRAAVIVNEFGAVGVDGALLAARVRALVELTGGCVCCATQAELVRALVDLARDESPPARIFVETSGLASPAGVLRAVTHNPAAEALRLDGIVTVVDATRLARLAQSDLAAEQVGYADVLVLSRADACDAAALAAARAALAAHNPAAVVVPAARGVLLDDAPPGASLDAALARRGADFAPRPAMTPASRAATVHDGAIGSVALVHAGELDEERLGDWVESHLARVGGRLLRLKGIVAVAGVDARVVLQGVADQVEVTLGAPWGPHEPRTSRVVLVGFGLDREELAAGFAACAHAPG